MAQQSNGLKIGHRFKLYLLLILSALFAFLASDVVRGGSGYQAVSLYVLSNQTSDCTSSCKQVVTGQVVGTGQSGTFTRSIAKNSNDGSFAPVGSNTDFWVKDNNYGALVTEPPRQGPWMEIGIAASAVLILFIVFEVVQLRKRRK